MGLIKYKQKLVKIFQLLIFVLSIQVVSAQEKPNIILIMTDDQGWFDVGFNGNASVLTPNLDNLASKGVVFDRFYAASPAGGGTKASVLTGRNIHRVGSEGSGNLDTREVTIPKLLKKIGYVTGHFGQWGLGVDVRNELRVVDSIGVQAYNVPSFYGYDEYFYTNKNTPTYNPMVTPEKFSSGESLNFGWTALENGEKVNSYDAAYWDGSESKVTECLDGDDSMIIMDRVIPFIKKSVKDNKPFFTTIWAHTPHLPVVTSKYYKDKYRVLSNEDQLYYGSISAFDDQIGVLWETLESQGIADNTILWFCSDNGPEKNSPGKAKPFKGKKGSLDEGGLRVPSFVVWCNGINGGRKISNMATTTDLLPTITSLLGIKNFPTYIPLDGVDLMPFIENPELKREKSIGFKYKDMTSWISDQYKLVLLNGGKTYKLYDLLDDKREQRNILATKVKVAVEMKMDMEMWWMSVERSAQGRDYRME